MRFYVGPAGLRRLLFSVLVLWGSCVSVALADEPVPAPLAAEAGSEPPANPVTDQTQAEKVPNSGSKPVSQQQTELPAVTVTGFADGPSTEGTGSYTGRAITVGKTPLSIRETPQAATVITRQRLDDQNLTTLSEALKHATGVTVQRFDGAGNFNSYNVRGFPVDAIQLDGLNFGNTGNVIEFDTAIYDRVEVLRGPGGLFQGSGEPSAVINLARKRALATTQFGGAATVGSWSAYRNEFDATGALSVDGRWRGRFVTAYDDRASYQDVIENTRQIVYGTLEYDLTPATTMSFGVTWQDSDSVIDQGLPTYADGTLLNVSRSTFLGADWNKQELESTDVFTELEHRLDNGGLLKVAVRRLDRYMLYKVARANGFVDEAGTVAMQTGIYSPDRENWSADAYASLPFTLGGQTHNLIFGIDWREQKESVQSTPFSESTTRMNVFDPDHDFPQPDFEFDELSATEGSTRQYGAYSQLRLKPAARVTLIGGGRLSWFESSTRRRSSGVSTADYEQSAEFTPYAAAMYDLTPQVTIYGSWAEVFQPQNAVDVEGRQLEPRTGRQYEAGIKAELLEQRLDAQFAVFRIRDKGRAMSAPAPLPDGAPPNASVAGVEVESQGFEAELSGRLMPGWELTLGYAYVDTEYLQGTAAQTGNSFATFTPRHVGNLWSKYQFGAGALEAFSVGAGIKALSSFYAASGSTRFEGPGYAVVSAQLGYRIAPHWQATLTADNLFDRKYYEKVSGFSRQNFYGEPLNLALVLRATF